MNQEFRLCEQCHQEKELPQFYRHGNMYRTGERMKVCIQCYKENREETQRQQAQWWAQRQAQRQAEEEQRQAEEGRRLAEKEQRRAEEEQVYGEAKRQAAQRLQERHGVDPRPHLHQWLYVTLPDDELPCDNAAYEYYKVDRLTRHYYRWASRYHALEWVRQLDQMPYVLVDTETTGTNRYSQVIEISLLDQQGQVVYHTLLRPTTSIEPLATAVHGLTIRDVKDSPLFVDICDELYEHLLGKLVLAYNASFDVRLLFQTARAFSCPFPLLDAGCLMYCFSKLRGRHPETERYKVYPLGDACLEMGIEVPVSTLGERPYPVLPHRAVEDTRYLWHLLQAMKGISLDHTR